MRLSANISVFIPEHCRIASSELMTESKLGMCSHVEHLGNGKNTRAQPWYTHVVWLWRLSFGLGKSLQGCMIVREYLYPIPISLEPSYPRVPGLTCGFSIFSANPCFFILVFSRQNPTESNFYSQAFSVTASWDRKII